MCPSIYSPVNPGVGRARDGHRFVALFAALLVAILALGLAGCPSLMLSPKGEYAATSEAYQTALTAAARVANSGRLSLDDAAAIEDARASAATSLDQADKILRDPTRPQTDARFWTERAQGSITTILTIVKRYEVPR